jgi:hypothetical protein
MAEATWGDANTPPIDWRMSASLENVSRGGEEVPEVTSLEGAVRAWQQLEPGLKDAAVLALERPVNLNGGHPVDHFTGPAIEDLAKRLPD